MASTHLWQTEAEETLGGLGHLPVAWTACRVGRTARLRRRNGTLAGGLATTYLRCDLRCGCSGCAQCAAREAEEAELAAQEDELDRRLRAGPPGGAGPARAGEARLAPAGLASHYLLPDAAALEAYVELLESTEAAAAGLDLVLIGSALKAIGRGGSGGGGGSGLGAGGGAGGGRSGRAAARLAGLLRDRRRRVALLHDEFHAAISERAEAEARADAVRAAEEAYGGGSAARAAAGAGTGGPRAALAAAGWLAAHGGGRVPVVVLSDWVPPSEAQRQWAAQQLWERQQKRPQRALQAAPAAPAALAPPAARPGGCPLAIDFGGPPAVAAAPAAPAATAGRPSSLLHLLLPGGARPGPAPSAAPARPLAPPTPPPATAAAGGGASESEDDEDALLDALLSGKPLPSSTRPLALAVPAAPPLAPAPAVPAPAVPAPLAPSRPAPRASRRPAPGEDALLDALLGGGMDEEEEDEEDREEVVFRPSGAAPAASAPATPAALLPPGLPAPARPAPYRPLQFETAAAAAPPTRPLGPSPGFGAPPPAPAGAADATEAAPLSSSLAVVSSPPPSPSLQPLPPMPPLHVPPGVLLLSASEYFARYFARTPLLPQYEALAAARQAAAAAAERGAGGGAGDAAGVAGGEGGRGARPYAPHWSAAAIDAGVASGRLLLGTLHVSARSPKREARIVLRGGGGGGSSGDGAGGEGSGSGGVEGEAPLPAAGSGGGAFGGEVWVIGMAARNRALHGDVVAARILPRDKWHAPSAAAGRGGGRAGRCARGEAAADGDEAEEDDGLASDGAAVLGVDAPADADEVADEPLGGLLALGAGPGAGPRSASTAGSGSDSLLPTVEIVGIVRANGWAREVVACLSLADERQIAEESASAGGKSSSARGVLAVPMDVRLPFVRLRARDPAALAGVRIVLGVDRWERGARSPDGHLVRVLGRIGDLAAERAALLAQHGIPVAAFAPAALAELPSVPPPLGPPGSGSMGAGGPPADGLCAWTVPPAEWARRRDLRGGGRRVMSIDPPGCTDVDDALSLRRLPGGGAELGVHIADVAAFVRPGGALDAEAAARGTTVYLTDQRLDMLPSLLSEDLCSLRAGRERLAVSVVWTLGPSLDPSQPTSIWFGRSVIRSAHALAYQQAQDLHDGRAPAVRPNDGSGLAGLSGEAIASLREDLRLLMTLTRRLRAARDAAGALELESAELRFELQEEDEGEKEEESEGERGAQRGERFCTSRPPAAVRTKEELPVNGLIAEMMIWANAAVAERIAAAFPGAALLRRHGAPRPEALEALAELAAAQGLAFDARSNASLAASLAAAESAAAAGRVDAALPSLLKAAATRAMNEAQYCPAAGGDAVIDAALAGKVGASIGGAMTAAHASVGGPGSADDGVGHYGLALRLYTHFTSPIRRYADVVVHRQLLAALEGEKEADAAETEKRRQQQQQQAAGGPEQPRDVALAVVPTEPSPAPRLPPPLPAAAVASLAAHLNERHRAAKRAQKSCSDLYLLLLLARRPEARPGLVTELTASGARVFVPHYQAQGSVFLVDREGAPRPPARSAGEEAWPEDGPGAPQGDDLRLEGGPEAGRLALVSASTGRTAVELRPMQRVWVWLAATPARSRPPALQLRLLDAQHPAARAAEAEDRAARAARAARREGAGRGPGAPEGRAETVARVRGLEAAVAAAARREPEPPRPALMPWEMAQEAADAEAAQLALEAAASAGRAASTGPRGGPPSLATALAAALAGPRASSAAAAASKSVTVRSVAAGLPEALLSEDQALLAGDARNLGGRSNAMQAVRSGPLLAGDALRPAPGGGLAARARGAPLVARVPVILSR